MKAYPQSTVDEFVKYVSDIMDDYPNEDYYWIFAVLCNDENSTDVELGKQLFDEGVSVFLIEKLIEVREYFWDMNYAKDHFWNPEY